MERRSTEGEVCWGLLGCAGCGTAISLSTGFGGTGLKALDQAAQGSGRVTIPGGVQKTCSHGTSGHGLAGMVLMG